MSGHHRHPPGSEGWVGVTWNDDRATFDYSTRSGMDDYDDEDDYANDEPPSPRTALLSSSHSNAADMRLDRPRRRRGPSERYRRERERVHSGMPPSELMRLLVNQEYETRQNKKVLYNVFDKLVTETRRASEAEERVSKLSSRLGTLNEARVAAVRDAATSQEELRLYKLQLEHAQQEIMKAQDVLRLVESQRDEAEASAARARTTARRLNEERLVTLAREEGRRLGFEEGLRRGREIGYSDGHSIGYENGQGDLRDHIDRTLNRVLEDNDEDYDHDDQGDGGPDPIDDVNLPPLLRSPQQQQYPPPDLPMTTYDVLDRGGDISRRPSNSAFDPQDHDRAGGFSSLSPGGKDLPRMPSSSTMSGAPILQIPPRVRTASLSSREPVRPPSRSSDFALPPDGYIPQLNADGGISMPAPHGLQRATPRPGSPLGAGDGPYPLIPPSPRSPSVTLPGDLSATDADSARYAPSANRRMVTPGPQYATRDYGQGGPAMDSQRRSSPESQSSASLSQYDLVSFPASSNARGSRGDRQNLSVIHEDSSSAATRSRPPSRGQSLRSARRSVTPQTSYGTNNDLRGPGNAMYMSDRDVPASPSTNRPLENQRLADALQYSDPRGVDGWRRRGENPEAMDGSPQPQPSNLLYSASALAGQRSSALGYAPGPPMPQEPQGFLQRPPSRQLQPSRGSSRSSSVHITVQPPSRPSSDTLDAAGGMHGSDSLSPKQASYFIPDFAPVIPSQAGPVRPPSAPVPTTPLITPPPLAGQGELPPGFVPAGPPMSGQDTNPTRPSSAARGRNGPPNDMYSATPTSDRAPVYVPMQQPYHVPMQQPYHIPMQQPPVPIPMQQPPVPVPMQQPPMMIPPTTINPIPFPDTVGGPGPRPTSTKPSKSLRRRNRTQSGSSGGTVAQQQPGYAPAPVPSGVQYPDPANIFATASPVAGIKRIPPPISRADSPASVTSPRTHNRSNSMHAGMTPGANSRPLPGGQLQEPEGRSLRRAGSASSLASNRSYTHFDPQSYLDPAFFVNDDKPANAAPAHTARRTPRMAAAASPVYRYLAVP